MFGRLAEAAVNAARDTFGYHPVAMGRHFLARFELRHGDGLMEFDGDGGVEDDASSEEEEIEKIIERIRAFVEPDLWEENGGPCSITNYKKTLLVNAPDFVHRQISGYEYEARMPIDARRRRVQYNGATVRIIVNRIPLP